MGRDPYLAFGLLGVPAFVARPITSQLDGRFDELTCAEAAKVLEGLVYLQWIKAAVVGFVGLGLAYLTDPLSADTREIVLVPIFTLMLWLPSYMLILGILWLFLRVAKSDGSRPIHTKRSILGAVRLAPALSVLPAVLMSLPFS